MAAIARRPTRNPAHVGWGRKRRSRRRHARRHDRQGKAPSTSPPCDRGPSTSSSFQAPRGRLPTVAPFRRRLQRPSAAGVDDERTRISSSSPVSRSSAARSTPATAGVQPSTASRWASFARPRHRPRPRDAATRSECESGLRVPSRSPVRRRARSLLGDLEASRRWSGEDLQPLAARLRQASVDATHAGCPGRCTRPPAPVAYVSWRGRKRSGVSITIRGLLMSSPDLEHRRGHRARDLPGAKGAQGPLPAR